jgi:hypothetical protein
MVTIEPMCLTAAERRHCTVQRAQEINPNYAQANYNLGLAPSQKGQVDDAYCTIPKGRGDKP